MGGRGGAVVYAGVRARGLRIILANRRTIFRGYRSPLFNGGNQTKLSAQLIIN